jgi:hypothetical protein
MLEILARGRARFDEAARKGTVAPEAAPPAPVVSLPLPPKDARLPPSYLEREPGEDG